MIYEVEHSEYAPASAGRLVLLLRGRAWAPEPRRAASPTLRVATPSGGELRLAATAGDADLVLHPDAWTPFTYTYVLDEAVVAQEPDLALEPDAGTAAPTPTTTPGPLVADPSPAALHAVLDTLEAASTDLQTVAQQLPALEAQVQRIVAARARSQAVDQALAARMAAADAERARLKLEIAELQAQLLTRPQHPAPVEPPRVVEPPAPQVAPTPVPAPAEPVLRQAPAAAPAPATAPGPVAVRPADVPVPRPSRRRLRPTIPAAIFAVGSLALADAVLTVVWKEPISSIYQARQQSGLADDLEDLDVQLARVRVQLPDIPSPQERMAALADRLGRDARAGDALGRLRIPKLDKSFVFVHGTGEEELRAAPGRYSTGALPGGRGTVGIAGHRTTYGAPFRDVDRLERGDKLRVEMPYGDFEYTVEGTRIVEPSDTSVLRRVRRDRLVLTACHPLYSAKERIIVIAELTRGTPKGPALKLGTRAATARRADAAA